MIGSNQSFPGFFQISRLPLHLTWLFFRDFFFFSPRGTGNGEEESLSDSPRLGINLRCICTLKFSTDIRFAFENDRLPAGSRSLSSSPKNFRQLFPGRSRGRGGARRGTDPADGKAIFDPIPWRELLWTQRVTSPNYEILTFPSRLLNKTRPPLSPSILPADHSRLVAFPSAKSPSPPPPSPPRGTCLINGRRYIPLTLGSAKTLLFFFATDTLTNGNVSFSIVV